MIALLAETTQVTEQEFREGYGGLIFMGLFFLALFVLGIWWLKRGA